MGQILDPFLTNINILILISIKIVNLGKGGYRFRGNGGWGKVYSYRNKGRTIRKVMGGMGKKPKKKFMQGKMPRKKIRAKKKGKQKIHAEGRSNCDFYLIYKICQQAY